uniref:Prenyl (decaprenyl) diphosphate synthase, subunit 1 n=1 Tax=Oryzias latipes TaxID=8090 RepID=A0A3P9LR79_ORYLA
MAAPGWRHITRWRRGCWGTAVSETLWPVTGRSASSSAPFPGRIGGSSEPGNEVSLYRRGPLCCRSMHSDAKLEDPFTLAQKDLTTLYDDIKKELFISRTELKSLCDYYFDGRGKAIRPIIVVLMARALNIHNLLPGQKAIAMITEMIHTASLVHDDVIDGSDARRGKRSLNEVWGEKKAILAGDFILSAASMALARIGDITVVKVLSQVIEDLVRGEFMQLGSKENENERFKHYLEKTFKKTASLIANSCKAVCTRFSSKGDVDRAWQYVLKVRECKGGKNHLFWARMPGKMTDGATKHLRGEFP